jgi:hypothetical protein
MSFCSATTVQESLYTPDWLHEGSSAIYEFGGGNMEGPAMVYFNACRVFGKEISGNYSWKVIAIEDGKAEVKVVFNLIIPGCQDSEEYLSKLRAHEMPSIVEYAGKRFVELAENGDFSFVKTLPRDQIDPKKVSIASDPEQGVYIVQFWGGFRIGEVFYITLDLYNLTIIDEHGQDWGKWLLWCNPVFYPVDSETKEIALYDWMNETSFERTVSYKTIGSPFWRLIKTPIGSFNEYYSATISPIQLEDPSLVYEGEEVYFGQSLTYETRIGILLTGGGYVDDILAQKLGIASLDMGYFWLAKLEDIELMLKSDGGINLENYTPHLLIAIVVASAITVYWASRKRRRH